MGGRRQSLKTIDSAENAAAMSPGNHKDVGFRTFLIRHVRR